MSLLFSSHFPHGATRRGRHRMKLYLHTNSIERNVTSSSPEGRREWGDKASASAFSFQHLPGAPQIAAQSQFHRECP